jgi:hypothetical protein
METPVVSKSNQRTRSGRWAHGPDTAHTPPSASRDHVVLRGTDGLIVVVAAAAGGTVDEVVVERVADAAGVSTEVVREDVVTFVDHLVSLGLLTRR